MTHSPTRGCPHRWCRNVHILTSVAGLAAVSQLFFEGVSAVVFGVMVAILGLLITLRVSRHSSVTQMLAEEQTPISSDRIDPRWARIALGTDIGLATALMAVTIDAVVPGGTNLAHTLGLVADAEIPWGLPVAIAVAVINPAVHRRAGRPGPPRKTVTRQQPLKAEWSH